MFVREPINYFTVILLTLVIFNCNFSHGIEEGVKRSSLLAFYERVSKLEGSEPTSDVKTVEPKIIGGTAASFTATRHQVSLRLKDIDIQEFGSGHICGGSLILSNFVVTAAHCVYRYVLFPSPGYVLRDASEFHVVLGDVYRTQKTDKTVVVNVKRVIPHELYCPDQLLNDVALLEITPRVAASFPANKTSSDAISVIRLASTSAPASGGKVCTVTGWGYTNKSAGIVPNPLQTVDLHLIDHANCQVSYGNQVGPGMLCAAGDFGEKSACNGDSGGPLVCDGVLHGIVSWGSNNCAGVCSPNVYTRVSYYRDWIEKALGEDAKNLPSSASRLGQGIAAVLSIFLIFYQFRLNV